MRYLKLFRGKYSHCDGARGLKCTAILCFTEKAWVHNTEFTRWVCPWYSTYLLVFAIEELWLAAVLFILQHVSKQHSTVF